MWSALSSIWSALGESGSSGFHAGNSGGLKFAGLHKNAPLSNS